MNEYTVIMQVRMWTESKAVAECQADQLVAQLPAQHKPILDVERGPVARKP